MLGERHHRRVAGFGHGTRTRVAVVDKHLQRRGDDNTEGGKQRENLGSALQGGVRFPGLPFSIVMGRGFQAKKERCVKAWAAGAGQVHLSVKRSTHMSENAGEFRAMFTALR